jgi:hypothetical protein
VAAAGAAPSGFGGSSPKVFAPRPNRAREKTGDFPFYTKPLRHQTNKPAGVVDNPLAPQPPARLKRLILREIAKRLLNRFAPLAMTNAR